MPDKSDSALVRMLAVLDLFDEQHLSWTAEDVAGAMQVSLPTAYRYLKLLVEAGLLQRRGAAQLTLGPRILVLDHLIRRSDPLLEQAVPFMKELVAVTGLDCVASALYGDRMLDIHREFSGQPAPLSYGRGRPRPLFLGAAPKAALSALPLPALRRVFDAHAPEAVAAGLPGDWPTFRRHFARIRKDGHYVSRGELESTLGAVAAPLVWPDGQVAGALSLVATVPRMAVLDTTRLAGLVQRAAADIGARLPADPG